MSSRISLLASELSAKTGVDKVMGSETAGNVLFEFESDEIAVSSATTAERGVAGSSILFFCFLATHTSSLESAGKSVLCSSDLVRRGLLLPDLFFAETERVASTSALWGSLTDATDSL